MSIHLEGDADALALKTSLAIEDCFAQHWSGGRSQRLAHIQCIIVEALKHVTFHGTVVPGFRPPSRENI